MSLCIHICVDKQVQNRCPSYVLIDKGIENNRQFCGLLTTKILKYVGFYYKYFLCESGN